MSWLADLGCAVLAAVLLALTFLAVIGWDVEGFVNAVLNSPAVYLILFFILVLLVFWALLREGWRWVLLLDDGRRSLR